MTVKAEDHVSRHSRPNDLRITDVRTATVGWDHWRFPIVRIDTNQGLVGYGEVRDGASKVYALMLKRLLIGENPCNVDKLFRKIKQFGHHARQGGGVCGIEMALMDLAGKAYGVPAYMLCGGKFRDTIRMYCDTPDEKSGIDMGHKLQGRLDRGFTMLKMDVTIRQLYDIEGALSFPAGMIRADFDNELEELLDINMIQHPYTHVRITPKGLQILTDYVAEVRSIVGYEVPIAVDHFGHIGIDDCIRLGEALEPFALAWLEDMVPWQLTEQWVQLERTLKTPVCTGEDIYLKEGFLPLLQAGAVNVIHPDLATSGGIMETKKIGDLAQDYGVSMALHMAGTPISTMASVHCAAATENFIALEHHFADLPFWSDFIDNVGEPVIKNGYIEVPDAPGLGFTLNEDVVREHLVAEDPGYFESSEEWENMRSWDRLWS